MSLRRGAQAHDCPHSLLGTESGGALSVHHGGRAASEAGFILGGTCSCPGTWRWKSGARGMGAAGRRAACTAMRRMKATPEGCRHIINDNMRACFQCDLGAGTPPLPSIGLATRWRSHCRQSRGRTRADAISVIEAAARSRLRVAALPFSERGTPGVLGYPRKSKLCIHF